MGSSNFAEAGRQQNAELEETARQQAAFAHTAYVLALAARGRRLCRTFLTECFFARSYLTKPCKVTIMFDVAKAAYPGVAQFGSALEWGSRGREFDSRHSDQTPSAEQLGEFSYVLTV